MSRKERAGTETASRFLRSLTRPPDRSFSPEPCVFILVEFFVSVSTILVYFSLPLCFYFILIQNEHENVTAIGIVVLSKTRQLFLNPEGFEVSRHSPLDEERRPVRCGSGYTTPTQTSVRKRREPPRR